MSRSPLLSIRLFHRLQQPHTHHPLYQQIAAKTPGFGKWLRSYDIDVDYFASSMAVIVAMIGGLLSVGMFALLVSLAVLVRIIRRRLREEVGGHYDLLGVTPPGTIGIAQIIAAASASPLHLRHFSAKAVAAGVGIGVVCHTVLLYGTGITSGTSATDGLALVGGIVILIPAAVGIAALEWIQMQVFALLLGMLIPTHTRNQTSALGIGGGLLIGMSLLVHLPLTIFLLQLAPRLLFSPGLLLMTPLTLAAVVFAVREGIIAWLWRRTTAVLNASLSEWGDAAANARTEE